MAQSVFQANSGSSPVAQDFIWLGEYSDGTHLSEFNLDNGAENSFYDLERERLVRFGLIGKGMKFYFERSGVFRINGKSYEIAYRVGDKLYYLTGNGDYSDIITFKDAESLFRQGGGVSKPVITKFNVGYKADVLRDGVNFNFKPILKLPYDKPVHLNIRLVADQELDGELVIFRQGTEVFSIKAPLEKGVGGEMNWVVK